MSFHFRFRTGVCIWRRLAVASARIRSGAVVALLPAVLGVTGCGREQAANHASLEVVNASDAAWRFAITGGAGHEPLRRTVGPRQTIKAEVPAGVYAIEQTLLTIDGGVAETRHFSVLIEANESYRWRLATLLSESR